MKIKFSENGSRIYDFFRLFANKQTILDRRKEDNGTNDICYSLLLSMIDKAGSLAEELEVFYYPECFFWWDFLPYFYYSDYSKEEDLLNDILSCDRKKLRGMILSYLLYMSKGIFIDKAKELLPYMKEAEKNGVFELLDELSISNTAKWEIIVSWNNPEKKRDEYIELMKKLLPIYLEEYAVYQEEVKAYGMDLENRINKHGISAITDMWDGIYDKGYSNTDMTLPNSSYLFISVGSASLSSAGYERGDINKRAYVQGFHLENGLLKLRQNWLDSREEMVFFFKNLGDSTRFQVLDLIGKGIGNNKELAETLSLTKATVSYHLNYLFNANMIFKTEKNGKQVMMVNKTKIKEMLDKFVQNL